MVTAAMAVISVKERRPRLRDVMQLKVRELVRKEPGFQLVNCAPLPVCLSAKGQITLAKPWFSLKEDGVGRGKHGRSSFPFLLYKIRGQQVTLLCSPSQAAGDPEVFSAP